MSLSQGPKRSPASLVDVSCDKVSTFPPLSRGEEQSAITNREVSDGRRCFGRHCLDHCTRDEFGCVERVDWVHSDRPPGAPRPDVLLAANTQLWGASYRFGLGVSLACNDYMRSAMKTDTWYTSVRNSPSVLPGFRTGWS